MFDLAGRRRSLPARPATSAAQSRRRCTRRRHRRDLRHAPQVLGAFAARLGDRVHVLPCNLSDSAEVEALVPAAEAAMGQVDILVAKCRHHRDNLFVQLRALGIG